MIEKYTVGESEYCVVVMKYDQRRKKVILGGHARFREFLERLAELLELDCEAIYHQTNKMKFVLEKVSSRTFNSMLTLVRENFYVENVQNHGRLI